MKLIKIGKPKAVCSNCSKEYETYGQSKHSDMLNRIKINDCSDIYGVESCKKK